VPLYQSRASEIVIAVAGTPTLLLPVNRNRVTYMISCDDATGNYSFSFDESFTTSFFGVSGPFRETFTYRDFGSIVREALFISIGIAPRTLRVLEIWIVPGT